MFYMLLVVVIVATAALTKPLSGTRTRIGLVSLAGGAVAVAIAEVVGNLALYYGGSLAVAYGVLVLLIRIVGALSHRGDADLQPKK